MPEPKLTIGIPHLDRTELLQHALDSALAQTLPARVLVMDQGQTEATAGLMMRYENHPLVSWMPSDATCLWENWRAAARACETEYFAWLQDDDVVERIYAKRIVGAFEAYPDALMWMANCHCSVDREHYVRWGWNGPQMPLARGAKAEQWPGHIVPASMFFLSWSLSPGVAFRRGEAFDLALEAMPSHCDLFSERLIVAAMAAQGPWIADPVTAGYWFHHESNESYRQNAQEQSAKDQFTLMCQALDSILDGMGSWEEGFWSWLRLRNPQEVLSWHNQFHAEQSRHGAKVKAIMRDSIKDRVKADDPEAMARWLESYEPDDAPLSVTAGRVLMPESPAPALVREGCGLAPVYE